MIQFKRGIKKSWLSLTEPLAEGQPGYDKERHKIKIGNGKDLWAKLPYASGLSADEILSAESEAKLKYLADPEDTSLITYGTESPDKSTVGQIYLQYYDTEPEVDYIVESGANGIWTYQKWASGIAECCGILNLTAAVQNPFESNTLYYDSKTMKPVNYPFTFAKIPSEIATLQSPGGLAWLASRGANTNKASAVYSIISTDNQGTAKYNISLRVKGFWK